MFSPTFTRDEMIRHLHAVSDDDFARHLYCIHLGFTFGAMNVMEETIVHAMAMCDRIKVKTILKNDAKAWEDIVGRLSKLHESTLGGLVALLSNHAIAEGDIRYLKFVTDKRNYFVHRFFRRGEWPGDLDAANCRAMVRRLIALNLMFNRVAHEIWEILARAGFYIRQEIPGGHGALMFNPDTFRKLEGDASTDAVNKP
jgi:hypothetical protein